MNTIPHKTALILVAALSSCGGSSPQVAGEWDLDMTPLRPMLRKLIEAVPTSDQALKQQSIAALEKMTMTITIREDGTYSGRASDSERESVSGTWKLDGKAISMTGTDDEGRGSTMTGTVEGGTITGQMEQLGEKVALRMTRK